MLSLIVSLLSSVETNLLQYYTLRKSNMRSNHCRHSRRGTYNQISSDLSDCKFHAVDFLSRRFPDLPYYQSGTLRYRKSFRHTSTIKQRWKGRRFCSAIFLAIKINAISKDRDNKKEVRVKVLWMQHGFWKRVFSWDKLLLYVINLDFMAVITWLAENKITVKR